MMGKKKIVIDFFPVETFRMIQRIFFCRQQSKIALWCVHYIHSFIHFFLCVCVWYKVNWLKYIFSSICRNQFMKSFLTTTTTKTSTTWTMTVTNPPKKTKKNKYWKKETFSTRKKSSITRFKVLKNKNTILCDMVLFFWLFNSWNRFFIFFFYK